MRKAEIKVEYGGVRFGPKVGHIYPKLDKSGNFSDQILVHLARRDKNVLKYDL